jgi:hypothetical protein
VKSGSTKVRKIKVSSFHVSSGVLKLMSLLLFQNVLNVLFKVVLDSCATLVTRCSRREPNFHLRETNMFSIYKV